MTQEELTLKWGTVKGWKNFGDKSIEILRRFHDEGVPMSAVADRPDENRKKMLCELIDQLDGTIYLEWDGKYVDKEEAKKYVMEYGARK